MAKKKQEPATDDPHRLFLVEVKEKGSVVGYAIAERVGYYPLTNEGIAEDPAMEAIVRHFASLLHPAAESGDIDIGNAIAIMATADPHGSGVILGRAAKSRAADPPKDK